MRGGQARPQGHGRFGLSASRISHRTFRRRAATQSANARRSRAARHRHRQGVARRTPESDRRENPGLPLAENLNYGVHVSNPLRKTTSLLAVTLNVLLLTDVSPVAVACSTAPVATVHSVRFGNDATPLTVVIGPPPTGTAVVHVVVFFNVTEKEPVGTTLPFVSSTLTCTVGLMTCPATTVDGPTANTSLVAAPVVILNGLLVATSPLGVDVAASV